MLRTFISDDKLYYVPAYTEIPTFKLKIEPEPVPVAKDGIFVLEQAPQYKKPNYFSNLFNKSTEVNDDPELRKRVTNWFYEKFNSWLQDSFKDLFRYLTIVDDKVVFVKNMYQTPEQDTIITSKAKADFILTNIIRKHHIRHLLEKFAKKNNANWFDLTTKHKSDVKRYIHRKLEAHMKHAVNKMI